LAAQKMSQERPGQTLQATALVHEAYIRLLEGTNQNWNSRGHFFKAAAESMKRILIENARRKRSQKRGGNKKRIDLDKANLAIEGPSVDLLALDEALEKLTKKDQIKTDLVKLRYFAGLTCGQAARVLGISQSTADEHWAYAKAWLKAEITVQDKSNMA
jgi:RNA polymerase sigma factor (TIGR02999 family)